VRRAAGAGLAADTAVGQPDGGPPTAAAATAVLDHLLVPVIAGSADPALGTAGIDPPDLPAASAFSGAAAGGAGAAYPAGGRQAAQVGRDRGASGAGRGGNCPVPSLDQRVRDPDQGQRIPGRGDDQRAGVLPQAVVKLAQGPPPVRAGRGKDAERRVLV
jgi:hypothetical protein